MRVLFITGRELEYPRNDVLLRAFRRFSQVEVLDSRQPSKSLLMHSIRLALQMAPYLRTQTYDLVFIGFYGHLLMLPAGLLARSPVLFDAFVSTYDTLVEDRVTLRPGSPQAILAGWLDRQACRSASHVLLDTLLHIDYFVETFGLPLDKFSALPVGCNEEIFFPRPLLASHRSEQTRVLYYCSYLPLHGADTIVQAASLLQEAPLRFRLIGAGQTFDQVYQLARSLKLKNIEFLPPVPLHQLPDELAQADICLGGHFGLSAKAGRVVPGKVYQMLAMRRPMVVGDTPANRYFLRDGETALFCPPGEPQALANAILKLHEDNNLRLQLAEAGRTLYESTCSEAIITRRLQELVLALKTNPAARIQNGR